MPEVLWYYARNDQQFGPVSAAELKQLADTGRLSPDDLLWREGMDTWATAINLRGLFSSDATANTPPPASSEAIVRPAPSQTASTQTASAPPVSTQTAAARPQPVSPSREGVSLRSVLRTTQVLLWSMCVLVVLAGVVLFTRAF
ncbi:MAG: GYF domain-containing protein, partial [Pirellulales bacterium]